MREKKDNRFLMKVNSRKNKELINSSIFYLNLKEINKKKL